MKLLADGVTTKTTRRLPGASSCLSPGPPSAYGRRTWLIARRRGPILFVRPCFGCLGAELFEFVGSRMLSKVGFWLSFVAALEVSWPGRRAQEIRK